MHRTGTSGSSGGRRPPKVSVGNVPNIPATEKPSTPSEKVVGHLKESQWANLAKREDEFEFVLSLIDEICDNAWDIIFANYIQQQIYPFAVLEARSWIIELIYRNYLLMDEGETDLENDQSWKFDEEPESIPLDSWSEGVVPVKHVSVPEKTLSSTVFSSVEINEQEAAFEFGDRDRGDSISSKESCFKKKRKGSGQQRSSKPKSSERKVCPLPVELQQQMEADSSPMISEYSQFPVSDQYTENNNGSSSDAVSKLSSIQILPIEDQTEDFFLGEDRIDVEQEQLPEIDLPIDSEQQSYSFTELEGSTSFTSKESGLLEQVLYKHETPEFAHDSIEPPMCSAEGGFYRPCKLIDIPPSGSRRHSTESYRGRRSFQAEFDEVCSEDLQGTEDTIRTASLPSTLVPREGISPHLTKSYPFIS